MPLPDSAPFATGGAFRSRIARPAAICEIDRHALPDHRFAKIPFAETRCAKAWVALDPAGRDRAAEAVARLWLAAEISRRHQVSQGGFRRFTATPGPSVPIFTGLAEFGRVDAKDPEFSPVDGERIAVSDQDHGAVGRPDFLALLIDIADEKQPEDQQDQKD